MKHEFKPGHEYTERNDGKPRRKRVGKAEARARTLQVYRELAQFKTRSFICHKYTQLWGVSETTVDNYIRAARKVMQKDFDIDRQDIAMQALSAYQDIYEASMNAKQFSNALGSINGITRLTRVDPATDTKR